MRILCDMLRRHARELVGIRAACETGMTNEFRI
jgi:hypothetical protein